MEIVVAIGLGVIVLISGLFYLSFTRRAFEKESKQK